MNKQPISVTLSPENLLWLRGRALASKSRSVSEYLDQLVLSARSDGQNPAGGQPRSIVGTITISPADPGLDGADAAVRALFDRALQRSAEALAKPRAARTSPRKPSRRTPLSTLSHG